MRPRVLALMGATAVGKTAVACALCERLGGEIVAADSRQVYRGLAIGSAAPTPEELARAPHHLVQCVDPGEPYTVAEFVPDAERLLAGIAARGRVPVLVVGTGMWLRALVEGWTLAEVPADPALRASLESLPGDELHARLAAVDPAAAERLCPADRKRLIRALEVFEQTGQPLSARHAAAGRRPVPFEYQLFGLRRPREQLYQRIEARIDAMLAAGWLDEVRGLLASGLTGAELSFEGLGYRQLAAHLRGELALAEAVDDIKRQTRRFAKRQMTWFRRFAGALWYDWDHDEPPAAVATTLAAWWRERA